MMTPIIILLAIGIVLLVLISIFRINAVYLYFSLAVGYVLASNLSTDTNSLLSLFSSSTSSGSLTSIKLILLLIPVIVTFLFMFRSIKKNKIVINLLPAVAFLALGYLLIVPILPSGLSSSIVKSSYWLNFIKAKDLLIELSALVSLSLLFIERMGKKRFKEHSGKHFR